MTLPSSTSVKHPSTGTRGRSPYYQHAIISCYGLNTCLSYPFIPVYSFVNCRGEGRWFFVAFVSTSGKVSTTLGVRHPSSAYKSKGYTANAMRISCASRCRRAVSVRAWCGFPSCQLFACCEGLLGFGRGRRQEGTHVLRGRSRVVLQHHIPLQCMPRDRSRCQNRPFEALAAL